MNEKLHIGELIRDKLKEEQRSMAWLAQKVHCDKSNFYKLLKKDSIDTKLLFSISAILKFDFFSSYSEILRNSKIEQGERYYLP